MWHDTKKAYKEFELRDLRLTVEIGDYRKQLEEYSKVKGLTKISVRIGSMLSMVEAYQEEVGSLLATISEDVRMLNYLYDQKRNTGAQTKALAEENRILKLWLNELGQDPDLVRYMSPKDFRL